jgi:asparagine N-glycosylation enzyme membrane subunit Stt3
MKHILKQRMNINESERSRILGLHDNFRTNVGGFLHEQNMDETTKFFADQKTKFNNFPDGKVVAYGNTFGYEVVNTDGTKYILLPNGNSAVDNGTGYKESLGYSWTKTPYMAQVSTQGTVTPSQGTVTPSQGTVTPSQGTVTPPQGTTVQGTTAQGTTVQGTTAQGTTAQGTTAQGTTAQGTTKTVSFDDLASDKDLRQGNRKDAIAKRKTSRQEQRDRKTRVENCTTAINNYATYKLDTKPDTDPNKVKYVTYLKTNCADLDEIDLTMVGL